MIQYLKSFFSFSIGTWLRAVISFFSTPVISYLIVPEEFGKAAMFTLVYNIAFIVSLMGLDQSFVRHYYQNEEKKELFWNCLSLPIVSGIVISLAFVFFESPLSLALYGKNYPQMGLLFSISLMTGIFQRFNQLSVRMQKRGFLYSMLDVVNSLGNAGGTIVFALTVSKSFYAIVFGQISGNVMALVLGFITDRESRKFAKANFKKIGGLLKYGFPLLPSSLLFWLFSSIDRISLRQYSTFTEIGLYSAAFKIVSVMQLFQAGFVSFWAPVAYEKYEFQPDSKEFFIKANRMVSLTIFLFGLLVLTFKDVVFLLFAKSYRNASFIVPFLILQPIMYVVSETTVLGINLTKKTYWHIVVTGISALANFTGNQILVPAFGAKGAAISTGLSYVLFFVLRTLIAEKLYPIGFDLKKIYAGTFTISVVALSGTFLENSSIFLSLSVAGIFFILLLYRNELVFLKNHLKNFTRHH
jgi:O-antigen/teichoic acid export membrane protein